MAEKPQILVLGSPSATGTDWWQRLQTDAEIVAADTWADALDWLNRQPFEALVAGPASQQVTEGLRIQLLAQRILNTLADGVALVDFDLRIRWANPSFLNWCSSPAVGHDFYQALGGPKLVEPDVCPFHAALVSPALRPGLTGPASEASLVVTRARLECAGDRILEVQVIPLADPRGQILLIVQARDVSASVQQQNKLTALYQAGRQLADLSPEQLAEMSVPERIDLLKRNIRRLTHELLNYEYMEIRLVNMQTNRLEPLLQEGMVPAAAARTLSVGVEGQGVTGYVAATGQSYLCPDTRNDPHYLEGAPGAHSSLTVPIKDHDRVLGTLNVESPRSNGFSPDDLKFAEICSRQIADALHTLELLSAEKQGAVAQSIEAVNREVALPVDDILTATSWIMDRYIGHDPELAERLNKILVSARRVKELIQKVGEDIAPGSRASTPGIKAPPTNFRGMRVLVADNDERVRRSAHSLLGRWGCTVETARDGQEALIMARLGAYDAIVADIRLPDMDGYEVYCKLRQAQPQARLILMSGYGYDPTHSLVKARQEGLKHVLFKPFRVDQLLRELSSSS